MSQGQLGMPFDLRGNMQVVASCAAAAAAATVTVACYLHQLSSRARTMTET